MTMKTAIRLYAILPRGFNEVGIGATMQGFPMDMVKCKTIDTYAIAEAEYVIEGYLDTTKKLWESPLAEKDQMQGVYPFHPEWSGYFGKAYRTWQFNVTAITHRKDKPIYVKVTCTKCILVETGNRPGNYRINGYRIVGMCYGECHCGLQQPYHENESPKIRVYVKRPPKDEPALDDDDILGARWVYNQYARKGYELAGMQ